MLSNICACFTMRGYTLNWSTLSSFSRSGTSLVPSSRVLRNSTWNSTISGKFPKSTSSWNKKALMQSQHYFSMFYQILIQYQSLAIVGARKCPNVIQQNEFHYWKYMWNIFLLCIPPPSLSHLIIRPSSNCTQLSPHDYVTHFSWNICTVLAFKASSPSQDRRDHLTYLILS